jgi:hypothetical protein
VTDADNPQWLTDVIDALYTWIAERYGSHLGEPSTLRGPSTAALLVQAADMIEHWPLTQTSADRARFATVLRDRATVFDRLGDNI